MKIFNKLSILTFKLLFIHINVLTIINCLCIKDSDCDFYKPKINCVWFECKLESCRSDEDCINWGWTSHFCLNIHATFLGTECVIKRESGGFCYHDNNCISGQCNWIFGIILIFIIYFFIFCK